MKTTTAKHSQTAVRCVLYLRVSQNHTTEHLALDRQRTAAHIIAKARGWVVVGEYVDELSASKKRVRRPGYEAMCTAYAAGEFEAMLCQDLDRLTRQPRQLEDWIDAAEERGLMLVTMNGEADLTTDGGRMYARIKAAVARAEVERKAERQRLASEQAAQLGRVPKFSRSFGYNQDGSPNTTEAPVVVALYDKALGGTSMRSLTIWLNDNGYTTVRGSKWDRVSVRGMLMNPRNAAIRTLRGEEVGPGEWPALVSEETLRVTQELLSCNADHAAGNVSKHLGTSLYLCHCAATVNCAPAGALKSDDSRPLVYRCGGPKKHMTRAALPVDERVEAYVVARLADPRLVERVTPTTDDNTAALRAELKMRRADLLAFEQQAADDMTPYATVKRMIAKKTTRIDALTNELARFVASSAVARAAAAADPVAYYRSADLSTRRAIIADLCTVTLLPARRGSTKFDPSTISIEPIDDDAAVESVTA